jgi:hypothetical protein
VDVLELALLKNEFHMRGLSVDEVENYVNEGWEGDWESCMYCGDATHKHDRILRRRLAKQLGKPTARIVRIWACDDCMKILGYKTLDTITTRRDHLIRVYDERCAEMRLQKEAKRAGRKRADKRTR